MTQRIVLYILFFIIPNLHINGQTQDNEKKVDQVIYMIGNKTGYQAVVDYELLIENYLFNENSFLPDLGCPEPEEVLIGDNSTKTYLNTS